MEQKCYVLRKTQTSVGCRTEPSRSSARFYIGALCNSATKLAAPKSGAALFCVRLSKIGAAAEPGGLWRKEPLSYFRHSLGPVAARHYARPIAKHNQTLGAV